MGAEALALWATLGATLLTTLVTAAWTLGRSSATKKDVDAAITAMSTTITTQRMEIDHSIKNLKQADIMLDAHVRAEADKMWAALGRVERDYARRDDVRDMGAQLGGKIDRLQDKLDEFNGHLIDLLKERNAK